MGAPKPLQKDPAPSRDPAEAQGRFIEPYNSQDRRYQNPCLQKKVVDKYNIYRLGFWGGMVITLMILIWVTLNGPPRGPQVIEGFPELKLTNTLVQDPRFPRRKRSFFKKEIIVTTHPKDSCSVTSVWGQQRDESWPKHMLHISATVDSPATFRVDLRTLLKCPSLFGCSAEGFGCNEWYLQVLDDQANHSDCFVCSHMPHSTSQPIAYATPMNITSVECAFNVSMVNASTAQCTHPLV